MSVPHAKGKGENDYKSETKYKQFSSAIEKALKTFEGLTEWHDLISSLTRINKVGRVVRAKLSGTCFYLFLVLSKPSVE